jgi:hypothetical protein
VSPGAEFLVRTPGCQRQRHMCELGGESKGRKSRSQVGTGCGGGTYADF